MSQGVIFDIQRFSLHDGPGIRTTVFLKGCPLSCRWCQNPEGKDEAIHVRLFKNLCSRCGGCVAACPHQALSRGANGYPRIDDARCRRCGACVDRCDYAALAFDGRIVDASGLAKEALRDRRFFDASGGGVTFSGGEPLAQAAFVVETAAELKKEGVHIAMETSLCAPWPDVEKALPHVDLFLVDLKATERDRHRLLTGVDGDETRSNFVELAKRLARSGRLFTRITLVPGYSEGEAVAAMAAFIAAAEPSLPLELMNFNPLAASKYRCLEVEEYEFYDCVTPFSEAEMVAFREDARKAGLRNVL